MLDPLTVYSAVGTTLQFVEAGVKLINKACEYQKSTDGAEKDHRNLTRISLILNNLSADLETGWSTSTGNATQTENVVRQANTECLEISKDFLQLLEKLQLQNKRSTWKVFSAALRSSWNHDKVANFEKRLSHARANLNVSFLIHMQSLNKESFRQIQDHGTTLQHDIFTAMDTARHKLDQDLSRLTDRLEGLQVNDEKMIQKIDHFYALKKDQLSQLCGAIVATLAEIRRRQHSSTANMLRDSLRFAQLEEREYSVDAATENTFGWILHPKNSGQTMEHYFPAWLALRGQFNHVFWISGKAASGKSTLMKYLSHKLPEMSFYLQQWLNGRSLVQAHCYFWNAGTKIQKSMDGLLRSILYQLLRDMKESISDLVNPRRWADAYTEGRPSVEWRNEELQELLKVLIERTGKTHCVFILIDGLDEFEGTDEDRQKMIEVLGEITKSENVKICASSRPWNIFVDAFEGCLQLRVEDFTQNDIREYVVSKFRQNRHFLNMIQRESLEPQKLVNQITAKADGVFLWVRLVVQQLLAGMRDGDDVTMLMGRLEQIPADLDTLFQTMLNSVEPAYLCEAAVMFQIMLHSRDCEARRKPTLLHFSYIDVNNPNFALDHDFRPASAEHSSRLGYRLHRASRRLNSRSMGLLATKFCLSTTCDPANCDVPLSGHSLKIDFLHRTVSDFFAADVHRQELSRLSNGPFAALSFCCNTMIVDLIPQLDNRHCERNNGDFMKLVESLVKHATEGCDGLEVSSDALQSKVEQILRDTAGKNGQPNCDGVSAEIFTMWNQYQNNLLTSAIQYGRYEYVKKHITRRVVMDKVGRPLLDYALWFQNLPDQDVQPSVSIVRCILELGADPNGRFQGQSIWLTFLNLVLRRERHLNKNYLQFAEGAMKLMVEHGADIHSDAVKACLQAMRHTYGNLKPERKQLANQNTGNRRKGNGRSRARGALQSTTRHRR